MSTAIRFTLWVWGLFLRLRWVCFALLIALQLSTAARRIEPLQQPVPPMPESEPLVTVNAGMPLASLPSPGQGQKTTGQCEAPEQEINGGCWIPVADTAPPCTPPPGKVRRLWAHEGRCWMPVARTARLPTSGAPRTPSVAEP